ncbi:hypothetical protein SAMN05216357_11052 [Porphyromonadaceae bacterium KH3CP3RA]|nr:hypothetical protein SAMN05216357_11052 [Porphyromonadaceae bacterium KH3CP3RA]
MDSDFSRYYELSLPVVAKPKRRTAGIEWTDEMIEFITSKFATSFNRDLADELGVGMRTMIRKARELGLEKEPGFLDKKRKEISQMAKEARSPNPTKGQKGWSVPGGEKYRFKPGHVPAMKDNPELIERVHRKRNETIRNEKFRLKVGLEPETKLRLKNY